MFVRHSLIMAFNFKSTHINIIMIEVVHQLFTSGGLHQTIFSLFFLRSKTMFIIVFETHSLQANIQEKKKKATEND